MELYEFTFVGCSVFGDGVHGVGLKQLTTILYVTIMLCFMLLWVVTSGPVVEHNNDRLNTTGLGPVGPTPPATHDDVR